MRTSRLIIIMLSLSAILCSAEQKSIDPQQAELHKSYGGATVERFVRVKGLYLFRCDLKDFPSVIGKDIGVLIDNIDTPDTVKQERKPNKFFESQVEKFLDEKLSNAKEITLSRIKRGAQFHLVANVTVDGVSLGDMLIREGLASRRTSQMPVQLQESGPDIKQTQRGADPTVKESNLKQVDTKELTYTASKSSKIFHKSTCSHAKRITPEKLVNFDTREQAVATGREPCKTCKP